MSIFCHEKINFIEPFSETSIKREWSKILVSFNDIQLNFSDIRKT